MSKCKCKVCKCEQQEEEEEREPGAEDIDIFDPEHQGAWSVLFKMLDKEVEQERED